MDNNASAVINLANKHLGSYRVRNGEIIPEKCPFCGNMSQDKETFAIDLNTGLWNCKRGNCVGIDGRGKTEGNLNQLSKYFGESEFEFTKIVNFANLGKKKTYSLPDPEIIQPITEQITTYFASRCISEETLADWKIAADKKGNIIFPFYRNDKLVYVKYRKPKKHVKGEGEKEWQEANTEPILFGMDNVSFNKPLVITEGEIDCLSVYEAGYHNVVSVPSGASNLSWVELCWDWLENFNQIILFGDSDAPGLAMVTNLVNRLGEDRCMLPGEYPQLISNGKDYGRACKDANEILFCYGPGFLKEMIESCEPAPVKGLIDVSNIPYDEPGHEERIMTGIPKLDMMTEGFGFGGVTVISGKRASGKSTFCNELLLNAVEQGYKCCAYSGELSNKKFMNWLTLTATESKYIGYYTSEKSGKNLCTITRDIYTRICEWLSGNFYLFDNKEIYDSKMDDAVLHCFEIAARRYGCSLFLIDNLMSLLVSGEEENQMQARFMAKLKAFATKYNVHVICLAHPRKEKADQVANSDSISGSSKIADFADLVLFLERPNIRVTKNRDFGEEGLILCDFDPTNRRIFQISTGDRKVYGWDHTGIKLPENPANELDEFKLQSNAQPF